MQNRQLKNSRRGMTLVELLVVVTIMVILLAVSVPMLRPMLESQKTSNAARVLAGAFKHARTKSIQEQRSYGIRLIPYKNAPTAAIELRLQKEGRGISAFVNPPDVRVKVVNGIIVPYKFADGKWQLLDVLDPKFKKIEEHFASGNEIQFNRLGRSFEIGDGHQLAAPYDKLTLPLPEENYEYGDDAMEYRVFSGSAVTTLVWLPPVVMPHSTIVDIVFSGGEEKVPIAFSPEDEVIVMFSPMGYVDYLYVNGVPTKVNEMLYFCVGEWDRQVDADGTTLAEDGKSNLLTPSAYWVTLHPKTGGVRVTENAPVQQGSDTLEKQLQDARRFAREHFFDVGQ